MIREGSKVTYVGAPAPQGFDLSVGDQGRVLADVGSGAHVVWTTGGMKGSTTLVAYDDLVPVGKSSSVEASLDDSLDDGAMTGPLEYTAVRSAYDEQGPGGLLAALVDTGVLTSLSAYAEDALATTASKIRHDPAMASVLGSLDGDEQDSFMSYLASALLHDVLREEE